MNRLQWFAEMLAEEGFRPKGSGQELEFKVEGQTVFLRADDGDHDFVALVTRWRFVPGEAFRVRALEVANEIADGLKVAKVTVGDWGVSCSVELFVAEPAELQPRVARILSLLRYASDQFFEKMRESGWEYQDTDEVA